MKTFFLLLFLVQFYSYGQRGVPVYIEDSGSKTNSNKNEGKDYRSKKIKDWLQLDSKFSQINRGDSPIGKHSKSEFLNVIETNNKILFFIESNRMLTKCAEINELRKNEVSFDNCKIVKTAFDFLKSQNKKAADLIKELEAKDITTFKGKDATLSFGKSSTVSNTNDKDFWNGKEEKVASKTSSKNEDDFWNGAETTKEVVTKIVKSKAPKFDEIVEISHNMFLAKVKIVEEKLCDCRNFNIFYLLDENGNLILDEGFHRIKLFTRTAGYTDESYFHLSYFQLHTQSYGNNELQYQTNRASVSDKNISSIVIWRYKDPRVDSPKSSGQILMKRTEEIIKYDSSFNILEKNNIEDQYYAWIKNCKYLLEN